MAQSELMIAEDHMAQPTCIPEKVQELFPSRTFLDRNIQF